jgi:hypothetical protein
MESILFAPEIQIFLILFIFRFLQNQNYEFLLLVMRPFYRLIKRN